MQIIKTISIRSVISSILVLVLVLVLVFSIST
jgi:hypothetical protein